MGCDWCERPVGASHAVTCPLKGYVTEPAAPSEGGAGDEIAKLRAEIARLREERRWISVEERLPEIGVGVLAIDDDGIAVHWWDRHRWCSKKACHTCPTHWQPLPPGPEGDG